MIQNLYTQIYHTKIRNTLMLLNRSMMKEVFMHKVLSGSPLNRSVMKKVIIHKLLHFVLSLIHINLRKNRSSFSFSSLWIEIRYQESDRLENCYHITNKVPKIWTVLKTAHIICRCATFPCRIPLTFHVW